ncbi:MAG: Helix-turn-helix domain [Cyanobacteriota bacterium]|jgi:transcriptional regulator with XRE-family HTH domain
MSDKNFLLVRLGRKIKAARILRGISQSQLADTLYCHQSRVSKIEAGKIDPGVQLFAIATVLSCTVESFDPSLDSAEFPDRLAQFCRQNLL